MTNDNLILATDSYKLSQWKMMPQGVTEFSNYFECRGGEYDKILFTMFDYYVQHLYELQEKFDQNKLAYAEEFSFHHFGNPDVFNKKGWTDFLNKKKGKLPLLIKAAPNNILLDPKNVLFSTECTDPEFTWMVQPFESVLMKVWGPITVGTYSYHAKQIIEKGLVATGEDPANAVYKLVDFGFRGVPTDQSAEVLGAAHLMNFRVSDNLPAIKLTCDLFNIPLKDMLGRSVPASEHSIAQLYGDDEKTYVLNAIKAYPKGILSIVIDKKDPVKFAHMLCDDQEIKKAILEREGTFVVRPDSGDPVQMTQQIFEILWQGYGGTFTKTGHKLLDSHIAIIQGDGVNINSIQEIVNNFIVKGYAVGNLVFGSGGKLLQFHQRDDLKCAIKANRAVINGVEINLFKECLADPTKESKPGKLKLLRGAFDTYTTISSAKVSKTIFDGYKDELQPVFHNGEIIRKPSLNFTY